MLFAWITDLCHEENAVKQMLSGKLVQREVMGRLLVAWSLNALLAAIKIFDDAAQFYELS